MNLIRNFNRLIHNVTKYNIKINGSFLIVNNAFKNDISLRFKYTKNMGVKGIGNRKPNKISISETNNFENEEILIEDIEYDTIAKDALNVVRKINFEHNVMVIQPYIKWGQKKIDIKPNLQLTEAESLIHSIPFWNVGYTIMTPVESFEKKYFFGKGKLEELKTLIKQISSAGNKITCLFISKGTLSLVQKRFLETEFQVPVMDRYSVVIQILRLHATSAEAKVQVAMAEIPYIWGQYKEINVSSSRKQRYYLNDTQKEMLRNREKKLKLELERIRAHRKLLRNKRKQKEFPIIAVVGYTNSGKTSLIKALTNETTLQPKNQLFATLDVTAYAGFLPCKLEVIFMDTVGFMSDIPTGLLECFIATLEDAMMADVIIHVQDLAHENHIHQKLHVEKTLQSLIAEKCQNLGVTISSEKIINVGNKIDLVPNVPNDLDKNVCVISSKTLIGISDLLKIIESKILKVTNRKRIYIRVKNGGQEMSWLYKNSAVTDSQSDPENEELLLMDVVISHANLEIFKHNFIKNQSSIKSF